MRLLLQEADLIRWVCGAHGGYETAEKRGVHRIGEGRGLRGGPGKRVDGVFPGRPRSFRYTPTSERLQNRTSGNDAERSNKGRKVS